MLVFTMFVPHRCLHKPNGSVTLEATGSLEYSAPGALFLRFDRSRAISSKMNTYNNCLLKRRRMCTYKITRLKALWNEHLQKNWGTSGARKSLPSSAKRLPAGCAFRGEHGRAFER